MACFGQDFEYEPLADPDLHLQRKAHFTMQAKDKKEAMLKAMTPEERAAHDHQVGVLSSLHERAISSCSPLH